MRAKDEILATALDEEGKGKEYMSLNKAVVPKTYAPSSSFYGEVMDDGYVFNPFIHRRWLPAQFENLAGVVRNSHYINSVGEVINQRYTFGYEVRFVVDEVRKLVTLQKHDLAAYEERSKFFDVQTIKEVLISYIDIIYDELEKANNNGYWYGFFGMLNDGSFIGHRECMLVERTNYDGTTSLRKESKINYDKNIKQIEEIKNQINKAKTLFEIRKAIDIEPRYFNVKKSYEKYGISLNDKFVEAFWKSGAYYSIKYKIMFEHKTLEEKCGAEACRKLREYLDDGYTAEQFQELYDGMD